MARTLAALLALVAAGALAAGCGGGTTATETEPPATTAPPATTEGPVTTAPVTTETGPAAETTVVRVYLLRGETVGVVHRTVEKVDAIGAAAMEELLAGPTPEEADLGFGTTIPEGTTLLGLVIENGVATVDLSKEFDDGGGSLSMFTRLAEVVYTLTQFPTVEGVDFAIEGEPVETFSGEGIILDHPLTRADYEEQAPPILVESVAPGDTVTSPLRLAGTSNTFEATFNYELKDAEGNVIADGYGTATCGTGCRGTFDVSFPFEALPGSTGVLEVFELSAKDGSRQSIVEIPVTFG